MTIDFGWFAGVYATDDEFVEGRRAEKLRARVETVASAALAFARAAAG